jgi:uncharacterized membrane protein YfcA
VARNLDDQRTLDDRQAEAAGGACSPAGRSPAPRSWRRLGETGLLGGLFSGLLGVGGGIVMVPLLVLRGGYSQRNAHAISLGAIIPISAAGAATYGVAGEIRVKEALALAVGAIAGANLGAFLLSRASERALKGGFGIFLLVIASLMVVGR